MKNEQHLPMYGVGPAYVAVIIMLTAAGIALTAAGRIPTAQAGPLRIPLIAAGILLIALGAWSWWSAVFRSRVDENIKKNTLVTTGIYAWVRNPIYAAFLMACTGALLLADNLWLLVLPPAYWLYLTVLMKHTEEKWLAKLYGQEYADYCKRVNRCIPWFPGKNEHPMDQ